MGRTEVAVFAVTITKFRYVFYYNLSYLCFFNFSNASCSTISRIYAVTLYLHPRRSKAVITHSSLRATATIAFFLLLVRSNIDS